MDPLVRFTPLADGKFHQVSTVASVESKIEEFLEAILEQGGFDVEYEILDVESRESDFETPDVVVKFSGPDSELPLALQRTNSPKSLPFLGWQT